MEPRGSLWQQIRQTLKQSRNDLAVCNRLINFRHSEDFCVSPLTLLSTYYSKNFSGNKHSCDYLK